MPSGCRPVSAPRVCELLPRRNLPNYLPRGNGRHFDSCNNALKRPVKTLDSYEIKFNEFNELNENSEMKRDDRECAGPLVGEKERGGGAQRERRRRRRTLLICYGHFRGPFVSCHFSTLVFLKVECFRVRAPVSGPNKTRVKQRGKFQPLFCFVFSRAH